MQWRNITYDYPYAVRKNSSITFYDEFFNYITDIIGISPEEWNYISIQEGEWTRVTEIPTEIDRLKADLDFLTMENESFAEENELLRADLDYCLMMLEEG